MNENDTLPLTQPIRTASGDLIDTLFVPKGTIIRIPVIGINNSEALWGADAAQFNPKRWLNESDDTAGARSAEIQGYRHLLTFGYGPRMCLGRIFAVMEIKVRSRLSRSAAVPGVGFHLLFPCVSRWSFPLCYATTLVNSPMGRRRSSRPTGRLLSGPRWRVRMVQSCRLL